MWPTNSVLCSARIECRRIPARVVRTCIAEHLAKQLALVPHAVVAALGSKARERLRRAGISAFPALHPSCRESSEAMLASRKALAERVAAGWTIGLGVRRRSQPSGGSVGA